MIRLYNVHKRIYQIVIIAFLMIVLLFISASGLLFSSNFAPAIVGAAPFIFALLYIAIKKPVWTVYAAVVIVLLPTGLLPAGIQSFLNRALPVIALITWGIYVVSKHQPVFFSSTFIIMAVFLLWCLVTLLWVENLTTARDVLGGYFLRSILFLFLIANLINNEKTLDGLMYSLSIGGWIFLITGLITILTQGYQTGTRLQIFEGNENTFGSLFPITMIGVIWPTLRKTNQRRTVWFFACLTYFFLAFIMIALSGSRGSAISWMITILGLFIWRQTRLWGIIGLLILLVALASAPFVFSTTVDRFTNLNDSSNDTLLGGREALWQAAWMEIKDRPITGVGVGNSRYAIMNYVRLFRSVSTRSNVSIHNPILTIWVDAGLPGVILYLGVLVSSMLSFVKQYIFFKKQGVHWLMPYFSLVSTAFMGYFATWIKGGGVESAFSYFLIIALLVIPSHLEARNSSA